MIQRLVAEMSSENIDSSSVILYSSSEDMWDADECGSSVGYRDEYLDSVENFAYRRSFLPNNGQDNRAVQGAVGSCRRELFTGDKSDIQGGGEDADERATSHSCPARPQADNLGQIAWTDAMHHLYLNSIEETFVRSLNEAANYYRYCYYYSYNTPGCARSPADDVLPVCSDGFDEEEVESRIPGRQEGYTKCTVEEGSQKYTENCPRKRRSVQEICCVKQTLPNGKARGRQKYGHSKKKKSKAARMQLAPAISTKPN